jgi:hypothetical protein
MFDDHNRFKVVSALQHLFEHDLSDFAYTNPNLPNTITNVQEAMDWIFNVLYPRVKAAVANVAALPAVGNTTNDQRVVQDDGDGNAAIYIWTKNDGQPAEQWNKIADLDWGLNSVLQALNDQTQYLYVRKFGTTDFDPVTAVALAGDLAGQHIYGGEVAGQNLVLHANNGDTGVLHTGSIFFDDPAAPLADLVYDFGEAAKRWSTGYFGSLVIGTASMTITSDGTTGSITDTNGVITFGNDNINTTGTFDGSTITASSTLQVDDSSDQLIIGIGSITDTTGAISFGDENLSSTGTLASGVHTVSGTLVIGSGSITDTTGTINFADENLTTTGVVTAGSFSAGQLTIDDIRLDGNTISIITANTDLNLVANGTGIIDLQSAMTTLGQTITGVVGITGQLNIDAIRIDGDVISNTAAGNINVAASVVPTVNNTDDLGTTLLRFKDLFLNGSLSNNTNSITMTTLLAFRDATAGAAVGDAIFWDGSKFVASNPDTEIDHGELSGIADDDHTQYALLAGRTGGQTLNGSDTTAETLTLLNNSVDADGLIIGTSIDPNADAALDLGKAGARYKDLYMSGEGIGFRAENDTAANIATAAGAAGGEGRIWYGTDTNFLYVDIGTSAKKVGHNTVNLVLNQTTLIQVAGHDVSATMTDPRNALWQAVDSTNNEEIMSLRIEKSATHVFVFADTPLPAGSYRLIGIEL